MMNGIHLQLTHGTKFNGEKMKKLIILLLLILVSVPVYAARIDIEAKKDANLTTYTVGDTFIDIDSMTTEIYSDISTLESGKVTSITAGTGIAVTGTATVPIITATGSGTGVVESITGGTGITVSGTAAIPIVTADNNGVVTSITGGTGITVSGTAAVPIVTADSTDPSVESVTTTGATLDLDYSTSEYHVVTSDQNCAISVTNWPTTGTRGKIEIRIINGGAFTTTIEGKSLTLTASGTDQVVLWTEDAGTTVYGNVALADM